MERKDDTSVTPAPTAASIAIFAVVVLILFGGMYLFVPNQYRSTASNPPAAEKTATTPAPPATTGQGGKQ